MRTSDALLTGTNETYIFARAQQSKKINISSSIAKFVVFCLFGSSLNVTTFSAIYVCVRFFPPLSAYDTKVFL